MIADAEVYGARWIVSLDDTLAKGIASGDKNALETWKRMGGALDFFQKRRAWNTYDLAATVGVISDFTGDNEFLGHEILNLAARRPLPLRILPKAKAASMDWTGLQAVVLIEAAKPAATGELLAKLTEFVNQGGILIAPEKPFGGTTLPSRHGYHVWAHGKGEVCVPVEAWSDPFVLAADVHLLVGRENDVVRLYNATSANVLYSRAKAGNRGVIQLLNYSTRAPASQVTVAIAGSWGRATFLTLDRPEGVPLVPRKSKFGVEFALPPFPVYAAIEVES
jgi:hypothetical protein